MFYALNSPCTKWQQIEISEWATLKAGMMEWRNGGTEERRKMTPNPKRWNRGTTENDSKS